MIPIYSDANIIEKSLGVDKDRAKVILARYRKKYRDEDKLELLDKYTIPTMYLIKKLSEDTFTTEDQLVNQFLIGGKTNDKSNSK